jgi:GT2 family glycosyltransferase
MPATLAIVILNYNGASFLQQFLPSVIQHSAGHRIIVADNASTDASVAVLKNEFPEVELLLLPANKGYAGGYNEALRQIQATYYLLLNSDVEVSPGWLDPMLELMDSRADIAACQPKILSWHQPDYFEYAGAAGGYLDLLAYPFCRGRIFDTLEKDHGQYNEAVPVFWATGACMMLRSTSFHQLGGFDASFFAHMEEIDLCWRIHLSGQQVYACPQSRVYHVGGGTLPKSNPRKTFLNFRNGLWMLYKNSSPKMLGWKMGARLLLDWIAAIKFLAQGQFSNAWAVLKAHARALGNLPYSARKKIQQNAANRKNIPLYKGFIVWDYYAKGVREFRKTNQLKQNIQKIQKAY